MTPRATDTPRPPLDEEGLERLALAYVGRYATTRSKLASYLTRKLRERGWRGASPPRAEAVAERMAELGDVDDGGFAASRAASLGRRGYGERRVAQALRAAGISDEESAPAREAAREQAWEAALRFARRKRIGPFSAHPADAPERSRHAAAMLRAGHPIDIVRRILNASAADVPDPDVN